MVVLKNEQLGDVLSRFILVAESPKESTALRVRLLFVSDIGECFDTPESCPQAILYVVVSNYDLAPDVRLYTVPGRYGWRFISWEQFPKSEAPGEYVVFVVEADEPSSTPAKGFWRPVRYRIRVNFHDGTITSMQAG